MGLLNDWASWFITGWAWFLADFFGWRVALSVYPPLLKNKVAIVSGANSGLGYETTKALLQQGATVVMACRSLEHAQMARQDILADPRNAGPVGDAAGRLIPLHLDLEDFGSVKQFVDDFHGLGLPLHLLVNNAGVHLKEHKHVSLGFERTMASNWFGHFWLTQMLLPDLKATAPARVVNITSIFELLGLFGIYALHLPWDDLRGQNMTDSGERPYTLSKTFMMMNTREMAKRLEGTGVDVVAVHPGVADTQWYVKADRDAYTFSWLIHRTRSIVGGWLGVGQPVRSASISSIYASIAPELTGATSSVQSKGLVDSACRYLFGGRLKYFGPSYIIQNTFNAWPRVAWSPWVYNKRACQRLYDASIALVKEVEEQLGMPQQQQQKQRVVRFAQNGGTESVAALRPESLAAAPAGSDVNDVDNRSTVGAQGAFMEKPLAKTWANVVEQGTALHE